MARPTFQLDSARIKSLREASRLTQQYVAIALHELLGKKWGERTEKSWLAMYQRIESTGRTSRNKAEKLASVLGVPLAVLEGKADNDYLGQLAAIIGERIKFLEENGDKAGKQRIADYLGYKSADDTGLQDFHDIAREIGRVIEFSNLSSKCDDLAYIEKVFGIPAEKLLLPGRVNGAWWLTLPDYEGRLINIFQSSQLMFEAIEKSWKERGGFSWAHVANHLEISRHGMKTRIEISNAYKKDLGSWWCEFAKCEIKKDGIQILHVQPLDEYWIDYSLKKFVYSVANRLNVHGRRIPEKPEQIFLRVSAFRRNPTTFAMEPAGTRELQGQQVFQEMPLLHARGGFAETDSAELLQVLNLSWGLKRTLHPFFKSRAEADWKVEQRFNAIEIELAPTQDEKRQGMWMSPIKQFALQFMWRNEDGQEELAPCRQCDLEQITEEIRKMVSEPLPYWMSEEDVLPFEPINDS